MIYLHYLWYIARHKWWVLYYARKVNAPLRLAILHDISKLSAREFGPYARWFYGKHGVKDQDETCDERIRCHNEFMSAWEHHKARNKHHPEYWYGAGELRVSDPMPREYIREMIADWLGAGRAITGHDDLQEWWNNNRERFYFNQQTERIVKSMLRDIGVV